MTKRVLHGAVLACVIVLACAGAAVGQNRAPPSKIDVMPRAANGVDPAAEFAKGVVALNARQYAAARQALEKVTRAAPDHYDSWGFLGAARAGLGDWAGSKTAYEQMLRIEPMSAHGHAGLALALAALQQTAAAQVELQWLGERQKVCAGKCTDRVLLQTMIPQVQAVLNGTAAPTPMASLEDRRILPVRLLRGAAVA